MELLKEKLFLTRGDKIMKKILTLLMVTICCCGCDIKQLESTPTESTNEGNFRYVEYDGHQYLIWTASGYRGGICHSPKCPCKIN